MNGKKMLAIDAALAAVFVLGMLLFYAKRDDPVVAVVALVVMGDAVIARIVLAFRKKEE